MVTTMLDETVRSELNELYKHIVKYELVLDAVRTVIGRSVLNESDNEHVALVLSPTQLTDKEFDALNHSKEEIEKCRNAGKRNIPALKGLVEKELDAICGLISQLESTTSSFNQRPVDIPSQIDSIQSISNQLSGGAHDLHKRVKILLKLHAIDSSKPLKDSLQTLGFKTDQALLSFRNLEDSVLEEMFADSSPECLETLAENLEAELSQLTRQCDDESAELSRYEVHRDQLVATAAELSRINREIDVKSAALRAFDFV